jgi:hypothetical protein
MVDIQLQRDQHQQLAIAFAGSGDTPLYVAVPNEAEFSESDPPRLIPLQLHSPAMSVARLWRPPTPQATLGDWSSPLWIEKAVPNVGGPWLVYATLDSQLVPTYFEIPYPFPDGEGGRLLVEPDQMPILVDYSPATHELLIAVIVAYGDGTVRVLPSRLPAPGAQRGVLVGAPGKIREVSDDHTYEYVQFYDDTQTFQMFRIYAPTDDPFSLTAQYPITEVAHGIWPTRVVDATYWLEGWDGWDPSTWQTSYVDPYPNAVLTDTGDVYIWQFNEVPSGEFPILPFGHAEPGARMWGDFAYVGCLPRPVWLLSRSGEQIALHDGDDNDVHSSALAPETGSGVPPWTTAAFSQSLWEADITRTYFAADTKLYGF